MKITASLIILLCVLDCASFGQKAENKKKEEKHEGGERVDVPAVVKSALYKKYAEAIHVTWEKENGNYEANWGGKSGEDNSVQFSPSGSFIEMVKAIPVSKLPQRVPTYVKEHYKGAKITEAGKITDARGEISYEAEINGKDVIFAESGNFVRREK